MCDGGNRVVFDDWSGSYIENKRTGERTPLIKKNGIYTFDLWTKGGGSSKEPDKEREGSKKEGTEFDKEAAIAKICEKVTERVLASVRELLESESAFGRLLESC